jgi:GNAT superfamily N-acetyltransferase
LLPDGNNGRRRRARNPLAAIVSDSYRAAMTTTAGYTITRHDPFLDTDEQVAERVVFANTMKDEILPGDPDATVEQTIAALRSSPSRIRRWAFRARDADGALVGSAVTNIDPDNDDNPDVLWVNVMVLDEHRRRGVGTRLFAELVAVAEQEGRTRIVGHTAEGIPAGAAFAAATGAVERQAVHLNHLPLAEVDRAMLERWVAEAATRAADYELIGWDGPVPDDDMARWLDLVLVMNSAPRDDLALNDFTITAEEVREHEQVAAAAGYEAWTLVVRHRETGEWAGFHDVAYDADQPQFVYVDSTGVRPDHRGHALGKWLKAAMTLRILDERPDVTHVRTGNADSNDAMLGINKAMGYRPLIAQTTWELPVETAAAWLADRSTAATVPSPN